MMNYTVNGLTTFQEKDLDKLLENREAVKDDKAASKIADISGIEWTEDIYSDLSELLSSITSFEAFDKTLQQKSSDYVSELERFLDLRLRTEDYRDEDAVIPTFSQCYEGWQKIVNGKVEPVQTLPEFFSGYFDSETFVKRDNVPLIGQLLIPQGFYFWLSPGLFDKGFPTHVPLDQDCTLFAHNSGFDAGKVSGTFTKRVKWVDTISLAIASSFNRDRFGGKASLANCYNSVTNEVMSKGEREVFVKMETVEDLKKVWKESLAYSFKDINPLAVVAEHYYTEYRKVRPSDISVLSHALIGNQTLPVAEEFIAPIRETYKDELDTIYAKILSIIQRGVDKTLEVGRTYFTKHLDWSLNPKTGNIRWYEEYLEWVPEFLDTGEGASTKQLNAKYACHFYLYEICTVMPLIPVKSEKSGWFFKSGLSGNDLPKSDSKTSDGSVSIPFGKAQNSISNIGSLLLSSDEIELVKIYCQIDKVTRNISDFISSQAHIGAFRAICDGTRPNATKTGRTGANISTLIPSSAKRNLPFSELRNRVSAPKGYKLVYADYSSMEVVAAAVIGASRAGGSLGATGLDRAVFTGLKSLGTDYYSTLAKGMKVTRKQIKPTALGQQYGQGNKALALKAMAQKLPGVTDLSTALEWVENFQKVKKGTKRGSYFYGGTDAEYENWKTDELRKGIRNIQEPVLGAKLPLYEKSNRLTEGNFFTQGGGFGMLSYFLVAFEELRDRFGFTADDFHVCTTVHDEILCIAKEEHAVACAKLMNYCHLLGWLKLINNLGVKEITLSAAWFDGVAIAQNWVKEPAKDGERTAISPTNPEGFDNFKEYTMAELSSCV